MKRSTVKWLEDWASMGSHMEGQREATDALATATEVKRLRRALLAIAPCVRYYSDLGTAELRRRNAETIVTAALARQPVRR